MIGLSLLALTSVALAGPMPRDDSSLPILAGIHTIFSWPDEATIPETLLNLTRSGLVGGVILFTENVDADMTPPAMAALQEAYAESPAPAVIESLTGVSDAPLLIMTDQEGGQVKRIAEGGPDMSAKEVGESADPAAAGAKTGKQAAETLRAYGNNANLAPVLDVWLEEGNFIDATERSYGNTSEVVSAASSAFIHAQQSGGVAATTKHFPGLGRAPEGSNTDLQPVTISATQEDMDEVDIPPFIEAISAGVSMVMPSWAIYPSVDADKPAGLSPLWLKGRLRGVLGFRGVTISDAIEAGSLSSFGDAGELGVLATNAGMDLLLASARDVEQGVEVRQALEDAVSSGDVDSDEFDAATERIIKLRGELGSYSS